MKATVVKLIAFVLVCLGFTVYLAFTIGNIRMKDITSIPFGGDYYTVKASFDDVTGLLIDANVKVAGVRVGKVTAIKVEDGAKCGPNHEGKPPCAVVTFVVKKSVKMPSDTPASIRWRDLLGQRFVYLYPEQGKSSTLMQGGAFITDTRSVVDLGELFNKLGPIVKALDPKQVNTFLDNVSAALEGNEDNLRSALDNLAVLSSTLAQRDQTIGHLVDNLDTVAGAVNDRDAQIREVLDNLITLSQTFSSNTDVLNQAVTDLGSVSVNLDTLLTNNRSQVDDILKNLNQLTDVVDAKLPKISDALANLPATAKALFSSARFGEWLNQVIPCGAIGRGVGSQNLADLSALCTLPPQTLATKEGAAGAPGAGTVVQGFSAPSTGVAAIQDLLAGTGAPAA